VECCCFFTTEVEDSSLLCDSCRYYRERSYEKEEKIFVGEGK